MLPKSLETDDAGGHGKWFCPHLIWIRVEFVNSAQCLAQFLEEWGPKPSPDSPCLCAHLSWHDPYCTHRQNHTLCRYQGKYIVCS